MKIDETPEMAYPQRLAGDIIIRLADPISERLVKLIAFEFDRRVLSEGIQHYLARLGAWVSIVQGVIRILRGGFPPQAAAPRGR
jgi:hypothetical protein